MYKHDFAQRLKDLSITLDLLLRDFTERYDLKVGMKYRVVENGNYFDGYFERYETGFYGTGIDVWVSFYKQKIDGTPSKLKTGTFISNIKDIYESPF